MYDTTFNGWNYEPFVWMKCRLLGKGLSGIERFVRIGNRPVYYYGKHHDCASEPLLSLQSLCEQGVCPPIDTSNSNKRSYQA